MEYTNAVNDYKKGMVFVLSEGLIDGGVIFKGLLQCTRDLTDQDLIRHPDRAWDHDWETMTKKGMFQAIGYVEFDTEVAVPIGHVII